MNSKPNPSVWKNFSLETAPYVVGLALFVMSIIAWEYLDKNARQESSLAFETKIGQVVNIIRDHMNDLQILLNGARGLLEVTSHIDRHQWEEYVSSIDIVHNIEGAQFLGLVVKVPIEEKAVHIQSLRKQGLESYDISPIGDRMFYLPLVFVEPAGDVYASLIGFDLFTEAVRRTAMDYARDEASASLTGRIMLGENDPSAGTGVMLFLPFYESRETPPTIDLRRKNLKGFVCVALQMEQLISKHFHHGFEKIHFQIYDGEYQESRILYDNAPNLSDKETDKNTETIERRVDIYNHSWLIRAKFYREEHFVDMPMIVLLGGILVSFLVFSLLRTFLSINHKANQLAETKSKDLVNANNRLKTILETAPMGIFLSNPQGECIYTNRAFQKIVGRTAEEFIGEGWGTCLHEDDRQRVVRNWKEAVANIKRFSSQHRFKKVTGEIVIVRVEAVEMREDLKFIGHVGIVNDMTDMIENQAALKQSEEKARFAVEELKRLQEDERQHTATVARMNNLMVDRELIMVELKNQIKELKARLLE